MWAVTRYTDFRLAVVTSRSSILQNRATRFSRGARVTCVEAQLSAASAAARARNVVAKLMPPGGGGGALEPGRGSSAATASYACVCAAISAGVRAAISSAEIVTSSGHDSGVRQVRARFADISRRERLDGDAGLFGRLLVFVISPAYFLTTTYRLPPAFYN